MKITNDHHGHRPTAGWRHDAETEVYAHGTGVGDDRISAHAAVGNKFTLRAGRP